MNFNSRPREGANPSGGYPENQFDELFQFPPPRGGEHTFHVMVIQGKGVQFPPPRGGEPEQICCPVCFFVFQFPPPRGGEPPVSGRVRKRVNFNSRPREGANSKTAQNRAVYLVSLLKFGRISAILPYILSATRAKKRETPKIIGFLLRRPTGRSCMEQVGAAGSVRCTGTRFLPSAARSRRWG